MSERRLIGMAMAAMIGLVGLAGLASAEDKRGRIISFDPLTKIIILEDGHAYMLRDDIDASSLRAGKTVVITYDEKDGRRIVTAYQQTN